MKMPAALKSPKKESLSVAEGEAIDMSVADWHFTHIPHSTIKS